MAKEDNSCGVFAVVMAILSILMPVSALPFGIIAGFLCGILGLVFGIVQAKKAKNSWAVWAIVLSIIGIVINVIVLWVIIATINAAMAQYQQIQNSGVIDNVKNGANLAGQYSGVLNATQ